MVQTNQNNDLMAQDQQEQRSAWKAENTAHGSGCSMIMHTVLGWKLVPLLCSDIIVTMILSEFRDFRKNTLQLN